MRQWLFWSAVCWLFVLVVVVLGPCSLSQEECVQDTSKESFSNTKMEARTMADDPGFLSQALPWAGGLGQMGAEMGFSAAMAKKAYKRNVKMYRHRYQWAVEDLRKAGLNPILAAGGLKGVPSGAPMASMPKTNALATAAQVRLMNAQTAKTNAEADILGPRARIQEELLDVLNPAIDWLKEFLGTHDIGRIKESLVGGAASSAGVVPGARKNLERLFFGPEREKEFESGSSGQKVDEEVLKRQPWYKRWKENYDRGKKRREEWKKKDRERRRR